MVWALLAYGAYWIIKVIIGFIKYYAKFAYCENGGLLMVDIAIIPAALNSLKAATDIVKLLRESDLSLEKAEMKLKLADLVSALADAKIQLIDIQEALQEKDKKIAELEEAFHDIGTLARVNDALYEMDHLGRPTGLPYCVRCWENDHKKRQLVHADASNRMKVCATCGHTYQGYLSRTI